MSIQYDFHPLYEDLWATNGHTRVRGGGFIDGEYHNARSLAELFSSVSSKSEFCSVLRGVNGFFAIIHSLETELLVATDRIRAVPVFYADHGDGITVGTDSERIRERVSCRTYDTISEIEYVLAGYVSGRRTLCNDINQVQAGEVVVIPESGVKSATHEQYYLYQNGQSYDKSEEELLNELDEVLTSAFARLIDYADGRPIVVSLSAGYDSRVVVSQLKQLDYDRVITFTYDYGSGAEVEQCREIANELGVQWEYVQQDHNEWWEWYHSKEREQLDSAAGIIDSVPTIGPAVAIKKLHEQERIPADSVFVTGDSASTTGEHIPTTLMQSSNTGPDPFLTAVLSFHYDLWGRDEEIDPALRERILENFGRAQFATPTDVIDAFEQWDWQERQAKHILRNYLFDFWGYDWWLPLWDREYMDFWTTVPIEHRYERSLHEQYVRNLYTGVSGRSANDVENSFHERSGLISRVEQTLTGTPLKAPAEHVYREYISPREYEENPIWGIMRKDQFDAVHSGRQVIHAFRALDVLGRMSFKPRDDGRIPRDGIVHFSAIEEETAARNNNDS